MLFLIRWQATCLICKWLLLIKKKKRKIYQQVDSTTDLFYTSKLINKKHNPPPNQKTISFWHYIPCNCSFPKQRHMRKRILQRKKINLPPNQDKAQCTKYPSCVFSLMWKDRFAFIPLYKRFRPLRAHFSLLGYKNGRVLGSIL